MYENLNELETISSNIEKEQHLIRMLEKHEEAEAFFRFAFNNSVYGIKEKSFYNAFGKEPNSNFESVSDFLFDLKTKELVFDDESIAPLNNLTEFGRKLVLLSGQEQLDAIKEFFSDLNPVQIKWWVRALLHNLRCGVQVKTINNVFKATGRKKIEKFQMQLAKKLDIDDPIKIYDKIPFPHASMETKYDGIRIQAHVFVEEEINDPSKVNTLGWKMGCTLTSRRGTDRTNMHPEICEALKSTFAGQNVILDGELVADSFQKLTRKDDTSVRRYVIFDLLNDEQLPYKDRWANLKSLLDSVGITDNFYNLINNINNNNLVAAGTLLLIAEHYNCNDLQELTNFYNEMNRRKEEGVIIKLDNRPYKRGSRTNMFKLKKTDTADLKIIGYKFGEGKRANKVGTLELIDASETIRVDVGSGIDDYWCDKLTRQVEVRNEINYLLSELRHPDFVGKICEIRFNGLTETGSIRFPRFVTIRDDKDEPDDLSNGIQN